MRKICPTRQVPDKLCAADTSIKKLVEVVGDRECSRKEMMEAMGLKDREHFMSNYLEPAIRCGYIRLLYPESPRHPRQRYLLTDKGKEIILRG